MQLAAAGFRVFPLAPDQTTPATRSDWREAATRDPSRVFQLWTDPVDELDRPFNIGIALDADTLVVDVEGRAGANALVRVAEKFDVLPGTYLVHTPDQSFHHYFRVNPQDGPFAAELCEHVGLKTIGDYVVAEGSRIGLRRYNRTAGEPSALRDLPAVFLPGVRK